MFKVGAVQVSPTQLSIERFPAASISDLKTDVHIKGVYVTKVLDHLYSPVFIDYISLFQRLTLNSIFFSWIYFSCWCCDYYLYLYVISSIHRVPPFHSTYFFISGARNDLEQQKSGCIWVGSSEISCQGCR